MSDAEPGSSEGSVDVSEFARVFVKTAADLPAGGDSRYDAVSDRFFFKVDLDALETGGTPASEILQKLQHRYDVEVVHRVSGLGISKERRYVDSPGDVPDGYKVESGPYGGVYYETNPTNKPVGSPAEDGVGYEGQPVFAVVSDYVDTGDEVAFERDDGSRDVGKVTEVRDETVVVETGDGSTEVEPAPFGPADDVSKAESGGDGGDGSSDGPTEPGDSTLDTETEGVHNDRYSPDDDDVEVEVTGGEVQKADQWVSYVGPEGGEGWLNVATCEVRYQSQRPGEGVEGDPVEDGMHGDWEDFDGDLASLSEGDRVQFQVNGETREGTVDEQGYDDFGKVFLEDGHYIADDGMTSPDDVIAVQTDGGSSDPVDDDPDEGTDADPAAESAEEATAEGSDDGTEISADDFSEADPETFSQTISEFIDDEPEMGAFLTAHPPEELEDHTILMTEEGGAGAAVSPEGDIQNVFNASGPSGAGEAALEAAIENGGRTLDCYDTWLTRLYGSHGFRETGRMEFNPEFAPEGWNEDEYGQPDVVFMHYDPDSEYEVTDEYYDGSEWDDAKQAAYDAAAAVGGGGEDTETDAGGAGSGGVDGAAAEAGAGAGEADGDAVGWQKHVSDYDMETYDESDFTDWGSLHDWGFPAGVSGAAMDVGVHKDAEYTSPDQVATQDLVFRRKFGSGPGELDPEEGHRQMVTYTLGSALGGQMPQHTGHAEDDGYVVAEGVDGEDIGAAPAEYLDEVDEDDFYEQAAIQVILGNNDAHMQNVKVTEDGDVVFHDIDHSAGDITGDFVGQKAHYDDSIDRVLGELYRSGQYVVDDDEQAFRERIMDEAEKVAAEYAGNGAGGDDDYRNFADCVSQEGDKQDPEAFCASIFFGGDRANSWAQALKEAVDFDPDLVSNVQNNIEALAAGDVQWQ